MILKFRRGRWLSFEAKRLKRSVLRKTQKAVGALLPPELFRLEEWDTKTYHVQERVNGKVTMEGEIQMSSPEHRIYTELPQIRRELELMRDHLSTIEQRMPLSPMMILGTTDAGEVEAEQREGWQK